MEIKTEYTKKELVQISRKMAYCLRHHPEEYGIELDDEGWVSIKTFLKAMNDKHHYQLKLTETRLKEVINQSSKQRYSIKDGKIRALYGHSFKKEIKHEIGTPPDVLFHGTSRGALDQILKEGLKPCSRQFVHLSIDEETAEQVGRRHDDKPVILKVDTISARKEGIDFFVGNNTTWLAKTIPAKYLTIHKWCEKGE